MKHNILKMSSLKFIGEGAYGTYYRIGKTKVGIKVLEHGRTTKLKAKQLLSKLARDEYNKLVQAAKRTRMVPRPKGLAIVEEHDSYFGKQYYVGYMMTHVSGSTVGSSYVSRKERDRLDRAIDRMEKLGIELEDNHDFNVMKSGKRFIFIDAARFCVKPIRKKKTKKKAKKK